MQYLIEGNNAIEPNWCCLLGGVKDCDCYVAGKACVQCGTLCAANCTELCGAQLCAPIRHDPLSNGI